MNYFSSYEYISCKISFLLDADSNCMRLHTSIAHEMKNWGFGCECYFRLPLPTPTYIEFMKRKWKFNWHDAMSSTFTNVAQSISDVIASVCYLQLVHIFSSERIDWFTLSCSGWCICVLLIAYLKLSKVFCSE